MKVVLMEFTHGQKQDNASLKVDKMCRIPVQLRELVKQRLDAVADEIFEILEKTLTEYEENLISKYEQQRLHGALTTQVLPELSPDTTHLAPFQTHSDEGQASEEPSELPLFQIVNAQGAVKEEPLLVSIDPMLVKEEPTTGMNDGHLHDNTVKAELVESKALSLLFIKQEQTEQSITAPVIHTNPQGLEPDQNRELKQDDSRNQDHNEQFMNQNLDQIPDQNLDLDQDRTENKDPNFDQDSEEDNVEWEFEGLTPPRQSPDETENSSEDDEIFPPDHPPKLQRNCYPDKMGQTPDVSAGDADGRETENSSNASDNADTIPKSQRWYVLKDIGKQPSHGAAKTEEHNFMKSLSITLTAIDSRNTTATQGRKQKRICGDKNKCDKNLNNSGAETNHICTICKRSFETLIKMKAHMKAHGESLPCPVCGKIFKKKHLMDKHMKTHQSNPETETPETAERKGLKRKRAPSEKIMIFKKRMEDKNEIETDTDRTEDSSDND